ncbi:MAG: translation elongation factor Ts [Oligoflexales bacterium]
MEISASQVKELREKTGVGMMECKKALQENNGDLEKAIVWLRERGMSRAAKKADRVAAEGMVEVYVNEDKNAGVVVEINCETDFVSKNNDFINFAKDVAALALKNKANSTEKLLALPLKNGQSVEQTITNLIATIGENIKIRRVSVLTSDNGTIVGYSHMGGKIGTLVKLEGSKAPAVVDLGKDLAMHVAASAPRYLKPEEVDALEIEQERQIARKKLLEEKKPENLIEKITEGQISKFYKEVCLLEQPFVKDPAIAVKKLVADSGKGASLNGFVRYQLGEGIEKKTLSFADEVNAVAKA